MTKRPTDANDTSRRTEATTTVAPTRDETFQVEDGYLVRKVVPRRGEPYEHRCPLDAYRELAWAAIDLAADGFTVETLTDQVRDRPREEHDDREPWASYTNAAVAIAFWKERGLLDIRRRRNHVDDGFFFEDAMIEFYALAENG
jgi:hypothetical protein